MTDGRADFDVRAFDRSEAQPAAAVQIDPRILVRVRVVPEVPTAIVHHVLADDEAGEIDDVYR